jgi:NADPH2:quinone reductase
MPFTLGGGFVGTVVTLPASLPPATGSLPQLALGQTVLTNAAGAFAEYAVAPAHQVAALPEDVDPKDGVHMTIPAFTAMYLVKESYAVQKGDWVLVRAAAGGVGLLLCQVSCSACTDLSWLTVQLVKHYGGRVIGTVSTEAKAKEAKAAGAEHVLLTTASSADNIAAIRDITAGKGVQVVYDGVGKDTWEENFEVVRKKGSIITYGNASGAVPAFEPLKLMAKCLKVSRPTLAVFIEEPEDFARYARWIFDAVKEGGLRVCTSFRLS